MSKFFSAIRRHRTMSVIVALALVVGGYSAYRWLTRTPAEIRYVLAAAETSTVIVSVTGSGQVSASNQVDVMPKVSGEVTRVYVTQGQEVKAGTVIAQIDSGDAAKAVRDAQSSLASAQLSLDKVVKPTDALTLTQAENNLARAKEEKSDAESDVQKSYEDGFNAVANAFLDLPEVISGLQEILYGNASDLGGSQQWNIDYYVNVTSAYDDRALQFKNDADQKYQAARRAYDKNFQDYKNANRSSDPAVIEALITQTYQTTRDISEAVKSSQNFIQLYTDELTQRNRTPAPSSVTHLTSLQTFTGDTNSHLSSLFGVTNTITTSRASIVNAERTIAESTQSLEKIKAGTDVLDIKSAQLSVRQRQDALADAREKLGDYTVRVPFDGVIAKLDVQRADNVSSGTALVTLVTKQKIADIQFNEVDAAKVVLGQKATLTFDAIEALSISGQVVEVDALGTVSQGVVSYNVKIGFDTQDDRIKSGMTVSAAIITDSKANVLTVPNAAIKLQGDSQYVEVVDAATILPSSGAIGVQGITLTTPPRQQIVTTGLTNDTMTEVITGLAAGEQVVIRTVTGTTSANAAAAPSLFGSSTGGGGRATFTGAPAQPR
jgi:RND family efflux transporter MFP subunit